ncbi:relaxase/mobilization nuclease domain-containing protein [Acinetobacter sp. ANC 4862]|uniref:relaxase/mobilization nuclease domain-containing protein n=1 Tax=Acinetobacter sp. ANC 4862 TaxID=2529849 RepID=UPI001038B5B5|nr:relaxase/mobilization nuclease domain-containing protein [Acinetobacter sp. ANC 4862]TCH62486.1 hypothetical protein E0409_13020 [Acinetobacter sp. ANC 4862]
MIVDFFETGTGQSKGPIDYFLGKELDREHAKLLAGNIQEVADLIDSSRYTKKYTAGCLSFYEDDLSESRKRQIMAAFERMIFSGLTPDNYRILWIEHRDKINQETGQRRLELNFIIPNVEILTGKRLQPFFAKADLERVDCFKRIVNFKYGLHDPDDPLNRQALKTLKKLPHTLNEFREKIHEEVVLAVADNLINDRNSLLNWLKNIGLEVSKVTKKQISVIHPDKNQPVVLKGELYEQNFRCSENSAELKRAASERYRQRAEKRYDSCLQRYQKLYEEKAKYHTERYGPRDCRNSDELTKVLETQRNEDQNRYRFDGERSKSESADNKQRTTNSDQHNEPRLAQVNELEPCHRRAGEAEKSPFFIDDTHDFNTHYFAYLQHMSRILQQQQVQRDREATNDAERRASKTRRAQESFIDEQNRITAKILQDSTKELKDEYRSRAVENYRRSVVAAKAAATRTKNRFAGFKSVSELERATRTADLALRAAQQQATTESGRVSADVFTFEKSDFFRKYLAGFTNRIKLVFAATFKSIGDFFAVERASKQRNTKSDFGYSTERDCSPVATFDRPDHPKNEFSRALSRKITAINSAAVQQALDVLDSKKLIAEQTVVQKKDQSYDQSPSI